MSPAEHAPSSGSASMSGVAACVHGKRRFRLFRAFAVSVSDLETEESGIWPTPPSTELKRTLPPSTQTMVARYTVPLVVTIENVADVFTCSGQ